jgi:hypothetical protein
MSPSYTARYEDTKNEKPSMMREYADARAKGNASGGMGVVIDNNGNLVFWEMEKMGRES